MQISHLEQMFKWTIIYTTRIVNCNNVVNKDVKYMTFRKVTRLTKRCNLSQYVTQ